MSRIPVLAVVIATTIFLSTSVFAFAQTTGTIHLTQDSQGNLYVLVGQFVRYEVTADTSIPDDTINGLRDGGALGADIPLTMFSPPSPSPATASPSTQAPSNQAQGLQIVAQGYGVDKTHVGYAFIVQNPNTGVALVGTQFQVAAYDASGAVLKTDSGYIDLVLPGQRLGIGDDLYLPDGATMARLDIQISSGKAQESTNNQLFSTVNVTYQPDKYFPKVTGVIQNQSAKDLKEVRVSAVAYDSAGKIIGGGFTFVDFVPANGTAAAATSITTSGAPAKVELFPTVTSLTLLG